MDAEVLVANEGQVEYHRFYQLSQSISFQVVEVGNSARSMTCRSVSGQSRIPVPRLERQAAVGREASPETRLPSLADPEARARLYQAERWMRRMEQDRAWALQGWTKTSLSRWTCRRLLLKNASETASEKLEFGG